MAENDTSLVDRRADVHQVGGGWGPEAWRCRLAHLIGEDDDALSQGGQGPCDGNCSERAVSLCGWVEDAARVARSYSNCSAGVQDLRIKRRESECCWEQRRDDDFLMVMVNSCMITVGGQGRYPISLSQAAKPTKKAPPIVAVSLCLSCQDLHQ